MAFELPPLPYAEDALEPEYSARTISFHYGKHHKTYVDTLNKLVGGTDLEGKSLEDVIMAVAGKPDKQPVFNNAAQVWNHTFFWNCMKPGGGGAPSGPVAEKIEALGGWEKFVEDFKAAAVGRFGSGWAWLVADNGELQDREHAERRDAGGPRRHAAARGGRVGARLLPRLPEPASRLRPDLLRQARQLGLREREPGQGQVTTRVTMK